MDDFDSRAYRDTMGQYCTGVVIVTGSEDGTLVGFAAQSFVSLSLDPPLVAVCPAKTSTSWPRIRATGHFCINVLAYDQEAVSEEFAQSGRAADVPWNTNATTAPILEGAIAYVECALDAEHDAGDHTVAVGRVLGFETLRHDVRPLIYFRGEYGL
ncbi:MAG: flavin reductase family protein [Gammaproteobacteria bacterium]|nr:flavin reductase family protein [Gammaproteobacteria bacterium]